MAEEEFPIFHNSNISKLKVSDLKRELKALGLNTSGNKNDLVQRLSTALLTNKNDDGSVDSSYEIDDDDVLNDEEIEQEVSSIKHIDLEINDRSLESETSSVTLKRRSSEMESLEDSEKPAKKIVLNRVLSSESISEVPNVNSTTENSAEKKIIKFSEITPKERLEMRAKKFGVPLPPDAKKEVRAQRFGLNGTTIKLNSDKSSIDVLKKRAERFGLVSSNELKKVDNLEKLEQRKARFNSTNGLTVEDKKAIRLQRFQIDPK